jgi:hypothetical protein
LQAFVYRPKFSIRVVDESSLAPVELFLTLAAAAIWLLLGSCWE